MSKRQSFELVKQACHGRWGGILPQLVNLGRQVFDGKHGPCPQCGGEDRFRAFDDFAETGGTICSRCGPHADGIATVAWLLDCTQAEAMHMIADDVGSNSNQRPRPKESSSSKRHLGVEELEFRDQVYRHLLASSPIHIEDRHDLERRGLTDEAIDLAGYGTLDSKTAANVTKVVLQETRCSESALVRVPGFVTKQGTVTLASWLGPGILIPCRNAEGQIQSLKVRRRTPRSNAHRYAYFSGGSRNKQRCSSLCHVPCRIPSGSETVRVTEGELKADVTNLLTSTPTIGVPGINQWNKALPVLAHLQPRRVLIAFDAPEYLVASKPTGKHAADFFRELIRIGYEVAIETWPASAGKGIDDVTVEGESISQINLEGLYRLRPDLATKYEGELKLRTLQLSKPESRTDLANSRRFIDRYGEEIRYCYKWKSWFVWDGKRWAEDCTGQVMQRAKTLPDLLWAEAKELGDDSARSFAAKSGSAKAILAMTGLAKSERPMKIDEMDQNGWQLNCVNGTLDLRTGELCPATPDDMITKLCPTSFNPDASSEVWTSFLNSTFGHDKKLIEFVQRLLGYSLTAQTTEQILPVMWGEGANGKSTLLTAFMETVGADYTMKAPHNLLLASRRNSHTTELADLVGKRFVACVETPDESRLNEALVKELTGGDRIRARRTHCNSFEFGPTHKLILCTNHRPRVSGTDHGFWRRIALIPFCQKFWNPGEGGSGPIELKINPNLSEELASEKEAILAWCVRGCLDWQKYGLLQPAVVREATTEYRTAEDVIAQWIASRCVESPEFELSARDAYEDYENWCSETSESHVTKQKFGARMKRRFKSRRSNGIWYSGVRISPRPE